MNILEIISCRIAENELSVNGELKLSSNATDVETFLKELYQFLETDYPKFYKMDSLSKLGFIAVEALVKFHPEIKKLGDDEIALIFSNRHSSLDTDVRYWQGATGNPPVASPALFVYTLPNIMLGEIAIRNKWHGENLFLVTETYEPELVQEQAKIQLETKKAGYCITGWVDLYGNVINAEVKLIATVNSRESSGDIIFKI